MSACPICGKPYTASGAHIAMEQLCQCYHNVQRHLAPPDDLPQRRSTDRVMGNYCRDH